MNISYISASKTPWPSVRACLRLLLQSVAFFRNRLGVLNYFLFSHSRPAAAAAAARPLACQPRCYPLLLLLRERRLERDGLLAGALTI